MSPPSSPSNNKASEKKSGFLSRYLQTRAKETKDILDSYDGKALDWKGVYNRLINPENAQSSQTVEVPISVKGFLRAEVRRFFVEYISPWMPAFYVIRTREGLVTFLAQLAFLVIVTGGASFAFNNLSTWIDDFSFLFRHPESPKDNWFFRVAIVGVVVGFGFSFFWLRSHHPKWYGILEVAAAVAGANFSLDKSDKDPPAIVVIGLLGSVYIVVRGLDNYSKSKVAPKSLEEKLDSVSKRGLAIRTTVKPTK
jgi:hypothetical protein